jgi:Zn finger protein HypA/HybF involved in hydrogenase expression
MQVLQKEGIIVDLYGRIYSIFCTVCGSNEMNETKTLSQVECASCGNNHVRVIRDKDLEAHLLLKTTERSNQWLS